MLLVALVGCDSDDDGDDPWAVDASDPALGPDASAGGRSGSGGSSGSGVESDDASAPGQDGSPPPAPPPPISTSPPSSPAVACPGGQAPAAYLLATDGTLLSFDPATLATRALGKVSCDTTSSPVGLTVSATGYAYVAMADGTLFALDLATLACGETPFAPAQLFEAWLPAVAAGSQTTGQRLFAFGPSRLGGGVLGVSDTTTLVQMPVGVVPFVPPRPLGLVQDAYGRMFELGADGSLLALDPTTGAVIGADHPAVDDATGWTLMASGSDLDLIDGPMGSVSRYDLVTKSLTPLGTVGTSVLAASAAPCAMASPPGRDGGAADAGLAGDAGSGATPFATGDVWIGTFTCLGQRTEMALAIGSVQAGVVRARLDFDDVVQTSMGSLDVQGTYDPARGRAFFSPGAWALKPSPAAQPFALDGIVSPAGGRYAGGIVGQGCTGFSVAR